MPYHHFTPSERSVRAHVVHGAVSDLPHAQVDTFEASVSIALSPTRTTRVSRK